MAEYTIPTSPWMPPIAKQKLTNMLERASCYLEYGAGGSSVLASRLGVNHIYSVESDKVFLQAVRTAVKKTRSTSTFNTVLASIGSTTNHGYPIDNSKIQHWHRYPFLVWERLREANHIPDFVLVDGRFRVACALACIMNLPSGATILLDDYGDRKDHYLALTRHADLIEMADRMAVFITRDVIDKGLIAQDLAQYCIDPR